MTKWGFRVAAITGLMAFFATGSAIGGDEGTSIEVEKPAAVAPDESDGGYRPPWANPNAKPPMPGIENDPTPFNPADVDSNSDTLNINNLDQ
jgi:hypothetical protein